ncbi:MAG: hypothetical protein HYV26_19460, partial [Candidatus Hydrogenedentes bacterium]|nr:hypothetical protein [Candidatus Hydrogenedentota bacterium]
MISITVLMAIAILGAVEDDVPLNVAWAEHAFSESAEPTVTCPFSFVYGGRPSLELLPSWECRVEVETLTEQYRRSLIFTDPATGLEVRAVAIVCTDSPGVDWTIYFTNKGAVDTPILEQVLALDTAFACEAGASVTFHSLRSTGGVDDWMPFSQL